MDDKEPVAPWVRTLVRVMDDAITIPGTNFKFGLDAIVGFFFPGAGDAVTAVSQVALVIAAVRSGAPGVTIARMLLNVALDALAGSVPILGDLFDAGFKANRRNLEIVEQLAKTAPEARPEPSLRDYAIIGGAIAAILTLLAIPVAVGVWLISLLNT
jgi:hypothetical protein